MKATPSQHDPTRNKILDASAFAGCAPNALERAARSDLHVMITGSEGLGKDVIARALHNQSPRSKKPFVPFNVGALVATQFDSQLLGNDDVIAVGFNEKLTGILKRAEGGTVFLDDVGDLPLPAQHQLLRLLRGLKAAQKSGVEDVRIISAAVKDVYPLVEQGLFLRELYFELSVICLLVPPLCNRPDDIGRITKYLLALAADEGLPSMRIERKALGHLEGYHWPGGFSELENLIRRLTRLYPQKSITSQLVEQELSHKAQSRVVEETAAQSSSTLRELVERHLAAVFKECAPRLPAPGLYHRVLRELELPLIAAALSATRGNQIKAAKLLGVNRNTLRRKVREFDGVTIRLTR